MGPNIPIDLIIYLTIGVVAIIGFLMGLAKGVYRTLFDLAFVIVNTGLAIWISKLVSKIFLSIEKIISILEFVGDRFGMRDQTDQAIAAIQNSNVEEETAAVAMLLPVCIICAILFIFIYLLISLIMMIPKAILKQIFIGKKRGNRPLGGIVSAFVAVMTVSVLLIPIIGLTFSVDNVMVKIANGTPATETTETMSRSSYDKEEEKSGEGGENMGQTMKGVEENCCISSNGTI